MTTRRVKTTIESIATRDQAEAVLEQIARATIARDRLTAEMELKLTNVRAEYEGRLTALAQELDGAMPILQRWAEEHPDEFGARKSMEMVHGTIGFRTGTPKLKLIPGKTWLRVLESLAGVFPEYIREKMEVNKEALIADREKLGDDRLRLVGLRVTRDETFFVEPKREEAAATVRPAQAAGKVAGMLIALSLTFLGGCTSPTESEKTAFWLKEIAVSEQRQAMALERLADAFASEKEARR